MASKKLINLSNLQKFLSKLNEKFALKKTMKGISEDAEGNIIIGEEGLVPTPNENSKGKFLRSDGEWALPSETAVYDSMTLEEGIEGVSEVDKVLNAKNLKQIVNSDGFLTSLDSSKLTGVINIENLPQGALERILIVSSKEERLTLLDTEVQLGDVVKEADTGLMYYVINTEKLNSEEGYTQFTAGMASSVPWSGVTNKPTIPTKTSDLTNDSNFVIDSDVVHKSGEETISGAKIFTDTIHKKNSTLDLQVNPSSDQFNSFIFMDKNNVAMCYLEHVQTTTGVNALGLIARDKKNGSHGIQVTSEDNVIPLGNGVVNLGLSGHKWKNVYATTFNGNLKGTIDTSTTATTQATTDNSTRIATTAWVRTYVNSVGAVGVTFVKGTNYWYRKHSDGFIEMGGFTDCALGIEWTDGWRIETNMPLAFSNTNYTLLVTPSGYSWTGAYALPITRSKTTTRFEVYSNELNVNGGGGFDWYACGY